MALNLRDDEEILAEANFHWLVYFYAFIWFTAGLYIAMWAHDVHKPLAMIIGIVFTLPFIHKYISNKCKKYIVTNHRIYISIGIIARNENEIPLRKINNVEMRRSFLQMIFGAGDIYILVGNDVATTIKYISHPQFFKDAISEALETNRGD